MRSRQLRIVIEDSDWQSGRASKPVKLECTKLVTFLYGPVAADPPYRATNESYRVRRVTCCIRIADLSTVIAWNRITLVKLRRISGGDIG